MLINKEEVFKKVNNSALDILGYNKEEILDNSLNTAPFLPSESKSKVLKKLKETLQNDKNTLYIIEVITKNGKKLYVEINSKLIKKEEVISEIIAIVRDITKKKKTEERIDFLHSLLRHDVQNKIQIVEGYLNLMNDFNISKQAKKYLKRGKKGAREGMDIINDILLSLKGRGFPL
ncbi:MAG: PAS domain S-box protein [archaeon]